MNRACVMLSILASLSLWPLAGHAAASCSILQSSGSTLADFGAYNPLAPSRDTLGQITLVCVPDAILGTPVPYSISIGPGSSGSFSLRTLRSGANILRYNLFLDAAHTQVFGDGTPGTGKALGVCAATCGVFVHGRLFGGQVVPAGTYGDDVLITLDF